MQTWLVFMYKQSIRKNQAILCFISIYSNYISNKVCEGTCIIKDQSKIVKHLQPESNAAHLKRDKLTGILLLPSNH